MRTTRLALIITAACAAYPGSLGPGALSGLPGLPLSEVIQDRQLLFRSGFEYTDIREGERQIPLAICVGFSDVFEAGAGVSLRLPDDSREGMSTGDVTISGAMLYETARGGTALKFTGALSLPTGEDQADPGAGISVGAVTTTTFRLFRFSASGQYRVLGGQNPDKSRWRDSVAFTFGGLSYLGDSFSVFTSISGDTEGSLGLRAGAAIQLWDAIVIDGSLTTDLASHGVHGIMLGVSWGARGI